MPNSVAMRCSQTRRLLRRAGPGRVGVAHPSKAATCTDHTTEPSERSPAQPWHFLTVAHPHPLERSRVDIRCLIGSPPTAEAATPGHAASSNTTTSPRQASSGFARSPIRSSTPMTRHARSQRSSTARASALAAASRSPAAWTSGVVRPAESARRAASSTRGQVGVPAP
jgi:hypothetical protein